MNDIGVLQDAVRKEAVAARQDLGDHPDADALLTYAHGELPPALIDEVQEHLALCPACARAVIDMASFPEVEPLDEAHRIGEQKRQDAWQRQVELCGIAPESVAAFRRRWPRVFALRFAYGLAASLLVATTGLSTYVLHLRSTVAELRRPRVDFFVTDLVPLEAGLPRGPSDGIRVPAWAERVMLLLNLGDLRALPGYGLVLLDDEGSEIWSHDAVRRSPDGTFSLVLDRRLLPAGGYRIELRGLEGESVLLLATYDFEIRYEPPQ